MKQLIISLLLTFFSLSLYAQLGLKKFGPSVFQEMVKSKDGGYYIIGTTIERQARLIKMDQNQNILWEKTFTGPQNQSTLAFKIYENSDQSIFILGSIALGGPFSYLESWIIKLDQNGQIIWNQSYKASSSIFTMCPNNENGYYLGGKSNESGSSRDGMIMKIDSNGNLLANFNLQIYNETTIKYLKLFHDGSLFIAGRTNVIGAGFQGLFFIRRALDGSEIYRVSHNTGYREERNRMLNYHFPLSPIVRQDGNFLFTTPYGYNGTIQMLEFDPDSGRLLDIKNYGDLNIYEFPNGILELSNGGYVISGYCRSSQPGVQEIFPFAIKISTEGKEIWRKYYNQIDSNAIFLNAIELNNNNLGFIGSDAGPNGILFQTLENGYTHSNKIIGRVFYDANSNCKLDSAEFGIGNAVLRNLKEPNEFSATDTNGNFVLYSESVNTIVQAFPNSDYMELCENVKQVEIDTSTGIGMVNFFIKPIDQCAHLELQILQPDLVKCNSSRYLIMVKNYGAEKSETDELLIQYDKSFNLVESTNGSVISGRTLSYTIPPLNPFEEKVFFVTLLLNCDAVLGASHLFTASISGSECGLNWIGPDLDIVSTCSGNTVETTITNHGADMSKPANFKTYLDQYLIEDSEVLLESGESKTIRYLTNGKSFFIELEDLEGVLKPGKYISDYVEACGTNNIGLYNLSNMNAFAKLNPNKNSVSSLEINTSSKKDKIQEVRTGLGNDHLIVKNEWLEYTVRVKNKLDVEALSVELNLICTENLEASSFQILGCSGQTQVISIDSTNIKIFIDGIKLAGKSAEKDNDILLKFRIKPVISTPFDSSEQSLLGISGSVYFNQTGPFKLSLAFNNLTNSIPYIAAPDEVYPDEFNILGGRYYTFGSDVCEAMDGSVFLLMSTSSFNERESSEPYIIKLDKDRKYKWSTSIVFEDGYPYVKSIVASNDGGCIIAGSFQPPGASGYEGDNYALIVKIDKDGKTQYIKKYRPGPDNHGGNINRIVQASDGNYIVTGYCQTSEVAYDNFVSKVDSDGNIIWNKVYIVENLAFSSNDIHELTTGEIIVTGSDYGRVLLCAQKIDNNGDQIWLKTATPQLNYDAYKPRTVVNNDGEIIFLLYSQWRDPSNNNYYITPHFTKLSKNGNYITEKTPILGNAGYANTNAIQMDKEGNFIVFGSIVIDTSNYKDVGLIAKFDKNFDTVWTKAYGIGKNENFYAGLYSRDERIHAIGNNQRYLPDNNLQAIYLVTDSDGNQLTKISDLAFAKENVLVYPNPASDYLFLLPPDNYSLTILDWSLYDLNGKEILNGKLSSGNKIAIQNISNGVYILKFKDSNLNYCKIIVQN